MTARAGFFRGRPAGRLYKRGSNLSTGQYVVYTFAGDRPSVGSPVLIRDGVGQGTGRNDAAVFDVKRSGNARLSLKPGNGV